jgi:hypothetical protein
MMRTRDAALLNSVVNHPSIRPHIGARDAGDLDMTALLDCDRNICLVNDHGGFLYHWVAPGVFEVHTFILPEGRGEAAKVAARKSLDAMTREYGADMVWTRIRPSDAHTVRFAEAAGFVSAGSGFFDIGDGEEMFYIFTWRP